MRQLGSETTASRCLEGAKVTATPPHSAQPRGSRSVEAVTEFPSCLMIAVIPRWLTHDLLREANNDLSATTQEHKARIKAALLVEKGTDLRNVLTVILSHIRAGLA